MECGPKLMRNDEQCVQDGGRRTVNPGDGGSIPPTAISKLRQFRSPHICLCLSEHTLKPGGPFYLVSIPREVKDPRSKCVTCSGLTDSREEQLLR